VSEDGGGVPAPLILDVSVLIEIARGDTAIMTLIQDYDAAGQAHGRTCPGCNRSID
jgi:hypothetical protein